MGPRSEGAVGALEDTRFELARGTVRRMATHGSRDRDNRSMIKRTVIAAADALAETLVSRRQRARIGRHLLNRASGDNEAEMDRNGERTLVTRLQQILAGQAAIVFDVGANVGDWTALLGRGLGRGSAVYAFEPVLGTFDRLREHLARLDLPARLVPVHAAVGEVDGEVEIHLYGGEGSGANSLHERDQHAFGAICSGRQPVHCHRGDTFCREHGIERIAFVKIDVEGHEMSVLRGFSSALDEGRIDGLQFEYGGSWIDARVYLRDAFDLLLACGYAVGKLFPDGVEWHERYDYRLETFQYANFVAVRPEWQPQLRAIA
jgi:FkbM family methyltransferase